MTYSHKFLLIIVSVFLLINAQAQLYYTAGWTDHGTESLAAFGWTMTNVGDVNGDSFDDFLTGGPGYTDTVLEEGRVSLYYGSISGISINPSWSYSTGVAHGEAGFSTDGGDLNGDGYSDIVIGCLEWYLDFDRQGKAVVFYGGPTGPAEYPDWEFTQPQYLALVGSGVALGGDVNGDGFNDLFISAKMWDNGQTDEGKVWLFYGSATGPVSSGWTWEPNQTEAIAGFPLNYAGDVNNDGFDDVIMGANQYDFGLIDNGLAVCFYGSAIGLNTVPEWTTTSDKKKCNYGHWLDGAGDVNGDGYDDVIVSALLYSNDLFHEGKTFVYLGSATGLSTTAAWTAEGDKLDAQFGYSVAGAGDINADGFDDVVIGAKYWDNPEDDEGACFVYFGSASGLETARCWSDESNQAGAYYGRMVGGNGDFNHDGFSDFFTSAYRYTDSVFQDGKASLFYGKPRENEFHYQLNSYCVDGIDPTPIIDGLSGGNFSSTVGLAINNATGTIDLSASTIGNYNITYTVVSQCTLSKTVSLSITSGNSASFTYAASSYITTDADPSPILGGGSSLGIFSSTAGLVFVNTATGVIDLSLCTPGFYVITNSVTQAGCGNAISTFNITINSPCSKPTGLIITAITATSATLTWSPVVGATSYKVYLKRTGFSTVSYNVVGTTKSFSGLTPSATYQTWVVTKCGAAQSVASSKKNFVTPAMRTIQMAVDATILAYPNPASSEINIELNGFSEEVEITLFELQGKVVSQINGNIKWNNNLKINVQSLPVGLYTIKAKDSFQSLQSQFIICR